MADQERPANSCPVISDQYRRSGFTEVEIGYSLPVACREATRCLHCDYVPLEEQS